MTTRTRTVTRATWSALFQGDSTPRRTRPARIDRPTTDGDRVVAVMAPYRLYSADELRQASGVDAIDGVLFWAVRKGRIDKTIERGQAAYSLPL